MEPTGRPSPLVASRDVSVVAVAGRPEVGLDASIGSGALFAGGVAVLVIVLARRRRRDDKG